MAVLEVADVERARRVLGADRFDDRLLAVTVYCGDGAPVSTFHDVLNRVERGDLVVTLRVGGGFELRRGRSGR